MPNFPFQRAKPLGYALFENFPSAHANIIDANAAQAADGMVWTDVAAIRNWSEPFAIANTGHAFCYVSHDDTWWTFGSSGGNPTVAKRFGGGGVWSSSTAPGAGVGLSVRSRAVAFNPILNVMVAAGLPGSSSNQKFRRYNAVTGAWTISNSSQTNTNAVTALAATPSLGAVQFVAAHFGSGVVETSADGTTWTQRTVPNAQDRSSIAIGPAGVVITSTTSTNKVLHSIDGINWFERTMPSATNWWNVVYVPLLGKFVAIADAIGSVATSVDGVNWVTQPRTLPNSIGSLDAFTEAMAVSFGRTIIIQASNGFFNFILYSQDAGATWKYAASYPWSNPQGGLATNGYQTIYSYTGVGIVSSIAGGY